MENSQPSTNPALLAYYRNNLTEAVDRLVTNHEIPRLSSIFVDFIYFLTYPDRCAKDFEKTTILDYAVECISLLGALHNVCEKFGEFEAYTKEQASK